MNKINIIYSNGSNEIIESDDFSIVTLNNHPTVTNKDFGILLNDDEYETKELLDVKQIIITT